MDASERLSRIESRYVALVTIVHVGLLVFGIFTNGPSWDEVGHLPAGIAHWETGRFAPYRVNPPLPRMIATFPLTYFDAGVDWRWNPEYTGDRPEFSLGKEMMEVNGPDYLFFLRVARLMCLPFAVLAVWVIWRWARELFGPLGGMLSVTVWCFSPMVLVNSQMIMPDAPAAACGVLAAYVFRRWLFDGTLLWAFLAGVAMGIAELTKFTWLILFFLWPLQWLLHRLVLRPARTFWGDAKHLAFILGTCLFVINLGYGFSGTGTRLGAYRFLSTSLGGGRLHNGTEDVQGNRFRGTVLASLPVPLPAEMINGIDRQKLDFEGGYDSYLRGEWRSRGWWYYYLYALAVKEPIGYLLLAVLATMTSPRFLRSPGGRAEAQCLLVPSVALLVFVSSQTGFSHHLRYILPAMPFLAIWVGASCRDFPLNKKTACAACVLAGVGAASSLALFPHSHAYFNEFAGGPKNGPLHLLNSNVDWGQGILRLQKWAREHPEEPLDGVAHALPGRLGIKSITDLPVTDVPKFFPEQKESLGNPGPSPGRYAIGVCNIYADSSGLAYFQKLKPAANVGYSYYIYDVSGAEVDRLRRDAGWPPRKPSPASDCSGTSNAAAID